MNDNDKLVKWFVIVCMIVAALLIGSMVYVFSLMDTQVC